MRFSTFALEKLLVVFAIISLTLCTCVSCVTNNTRLNITEYNMLENFPYHLSVVKLYTDPLAAFVSVGRATGFAVSDDLIMTAGHYCKTVERRQLKGLDSGKVKIEVFDHHGMPSHKMEGEVVAIHPTIDMCLIKSPKHNLVPIPISQKFQVLRHNDLVSTGGFPNGEMWFVVVEGRVARIMPDEVTIEMEIKPGCSGSPVIWQGQVIGMVVSYWVNSEPSLMNAVSSDRLLEFLLTEGE